jgi:hypothetical protein
MEWLINRSQFTENGFSLVMGLLGNGVEAHLLFDENRVLPFQPISEIRIRRQKEKSDNRFGIFGRAV